MSSHMRRLRCMPVVLEPQLQPPRDQKHDAISFEDFHFRDRGSQNGQRLCRRPKRSAVFCGNVRAASR